MATLGWSGAMLVTRSPILAKALFSEFLADQYDVAFRKAARFARYFWRRLDIFNDPFFDFTMGADSAECKALHQHLESIKEKITATEYLTDRLYIQAANIHALLDQGSNANSEITQFYNVVNQALSLIKITDEQPPKSVTADKNDNVSFDKNSAQQALKDMAATLSIKQWPWYVVSGTFLGLHREGGFLAHDYDIDLGINAEQIDYDELVATLNASSVLVVKKIDHYIDVYRDENSQRRIRKVPSIIKLIHENGMQIDLFIHYTENGRCWHGSSIHRWENTPFELVERELEGVTVYAPANADTYLTENYGDWRTPITEFDCTTGTPNLVVACNFISQALFIKCFNYFAKRDSKEFEKLLATTTQSGFVVKKNGRLVVGNNL